MRLIVLSLLLLAIAANGFSQEVEENELPSEEEESANEIETQNDKEAVSKNEVSIPGPKNEDEVQTNKVESPVPAKVPAKKGKVKKFLGGMKKVSQKIASGVKKGAKATYKGMKKGAKATYKGMKKSAKYLKKKLKNKHED